ncbi:hypothetical protein R1sor_016997 [Riccia sorocarpa]|uniref:Phosphoacetylglucosamine mutase n=1 Tax=Riccia sorocarpa TaxID=122646 RepID=A0ABD3I9A8_9MARC
MLMNSKFLSSAAFLTAKPFASNFRHAGSSQITLAAVRLSVFASCSSWSSSSLSRNSSLPPLKSVDTSLAVLEMDRDRLSLLRDAAAEFPPPPGKKFSYGTAGFRTDGSLLHSTVFRTGVLAALRSLKTEKVIGLVITASHNQEADNGIKVADPDGGMLTMDWEVYADIIANAGDANLFVKAVEEIVKKEDIQFGSASGKVLLARDTRRSGPSLVEAARKGIEAVSGVSAEGKGVLTTPQLHWMVRATNKGSVGSESEYFDTLSSAFRSLLDLGPSGVSERGPLIVDCSNGVGAEKVTCLQRSLEGLNDMEIRNTGRNGEILNYLVGADFVQKEKVLPQNFDAVRDEGKRCVSIDGDADRLVYFYTGQSVTELTPVLHLLDGDKIMALFAAFIADQLRSIVNVTGSAVKQESFAPVIPGYGAVKFGVVQTAYANGASTRYLQQNLGLEVVLTPTGVKHLHEKAAAYDIGIYFEANGHGTVLFRDSFVHWLKKNGDTLPAVEGKLAAKRLEAVSELVNQAVGDALSGILMVELILRYQGWSIQQWDTIYTDLPSRQLKVKVLDRSVITTTAAETRVKSIPQLQEAIDNEVEKYEAGRAFVRPSGTEDVVRVYAEAATQELADNLAREVGLLVHQLAGGV